MFNNNSKLFTNNKLCNLDNLYITKLFRPFENKAVFTKTINILNKCLNQEDYVYLDYCGDHYGDFSEICINGDINILLNKEQSKEIHNIVLPNHKESEIYNSYVGKIILKFRTEEQLILAKVILNV